MLNIKLQNIVTSPLRVERSFEEDGVLNELKNNIKTYGIQVPLIVKKIGEDTYELVDGHRRLQVAKALDFETVPCVITDENTSLEVALSVNIHREDLTAVETGKLISSIYYNEKQKDDSFTYKKLAEMIHKSKAYISQHIGYIEKLSTDIQEDIVDNKRFIDKNILNRICKLDEDTQKVVYGEVVENNLNREGVQKFIDELNKDEEPQDDTKSNLSLEEPKGEVNNTITFDVSILSDEDKLKFEDELHSLLKKYNLIRGV